MIKIREAVIVEGRYDKNTLSQAVDTLIIETGGFSIFNDKERLEYIRRVADKRGIIILTDPDGAGFVIRRYLRGAVSPDRLKQAYIPDIPGREHRKKTPSKEGLLGVEGMTPEILISALRRAGATVENGDAAASKPFTKAELYAAGLSGGEGSAKKRAALLNELGLPGRLSANGLCEALGCLVTREEYEDALKKISLMQL